jgi:hypothetical protein
MFFGSREREVFSFSPRLVALHQKERSVLLIYYFEFDEVLTRLRIDCDL